MEANLKKVIGDLNRSRGVAEGSSLTDATANPIAKVRAYLLLLLKARCSVAPYASVLQMVMTLPSISQLRGCLDHPVVLSSCFLFTLVLNYLFISFYLHQIVAVLNNHHDSLAWLDEKSRYTVRSI
jgi:hypothetical protein